MKGCPFEGVSFLKACSFEGVSFLKAASFLKAVPLLVGKTYPASFHHIDTLINLILLVFSLFLNLLFCGLGATYLNLILI